MLENIYYFVKLLSKNKVKIFENIKEAPKFDYDVLSKWLIRLLIPK